MTNAELWHIAMRQSAIDSGCRVEDFEKQEPVVVLSGAHPGARKYLKLPFLCDLTSYGNNIVASVCPELREMITGYLARFSAAHCFETPNLHVLMEQLRLLGMNVCFMAEYFLPDLQLIQPLSCHFPLRMLEQAQLSDLYLPQWSNALCKERKELDMVAFAAYDGGRIIGMAGASADCAEMWQIGVDVLPEYRRQGIASALTSALALEILRRGKVPFYCCAWSNVGSARNAIRSGFRPAWVQATVKENDFIADMNT